MRPERLFLMIAGMIAIAGLSMQFVVSSNLFPTTLATAWRMLGYFTILTNVITALYFVLRGAPANASSRDRWIATPFAATWVCLSIVFVGLGYALLLAKLYSPTGMVWWANLFLHYVTPAVALAYWLIFVRKGSLSWTDPIKWSSYVVAYGFYAVARGASSGFYPYPFLEVPTLGMSGVITNMFGVLAAFIATGMIFVLVDKRWPQTAASGSVRS